MGPADPQSAPAEPWPAPTDPQSALTDFWPAPARLLSGATGSLKDAAWRSNGALAGEGPHWSRSPPHPHFSGISHSSGRQGVGVQAGPQYHLSPPPSCREQSEEEGEKSKRKKRKKVTEGQGEGSSSDEGSDSSSSSSESEVSSESEEEQAEPVSWRKKTVRFWGQEGWAQGQGPTTFRNIQCVLYLGTLSHAHTPCSLAAYQQQKCPRSQGGLPAGS